MTDNVVTTGIYTLENGAVVKVYNPRDCYLTWADGQAILAYEEVVDGCKNWRMVRKLKILVELENEGGEGR